MNLTPESEPIQLRKSSARPPAPIRTDEEALGRTLQAAMLPALERLTRMTEAVDRCARALEEYNRRSR